MVSSGSLDFFDKTMLTQSFQYPACFCTLPVTIFHIWKDELAALTDEVAERSTELPLRIDPEDGIPPKGWQEEQSLPKAEPPVVKPTKLELPEIDPEDGLPVRTDSPEIDPEEGVSPIKREPPKVDPEEENLPQKENKELKEKEEEEEEEYSGEAWYKYFSEKYGAEKVEWVSQKPTGEDWRGYLIDKYGFEKVEWNEADRLLEGAQIP